MGKPRFAGFPWPEAAKASSGTPLPAEVRGNACLALLSRRSRTPATLPLGRKKIKGNRSSICQSVTPAGKGSTRERFFDLFIISLCSFYPERGRCGRGRAFAKGKHRLPLPQEGVRRRHGFAWLRPGGTAIAVPPPEKLLLKLPEAELRGIFYRRGNICNALANPGAELRGPRSSLPCARCACSIPETWIEDTSNTSSSTIQVFFSSPFFIHKLPACELLVYSAA